MPESKPHNQSDGQPERRPLPWTEPRVTVDGIVGQVDATVVPRYGGEPTFARLPRLCDVPRADIAILGVPFDTGVSYRPGARFGPGHIRESSRLLRPYNPALRVSPFAALQVADAGDIGVNPFDIGEAIAAIEHGARDLLERAPRLLTLGGDHTIALPLLRAVHAAHGPVAVVHFDAHLDTWDTYFGAPYTHGTPFRRAFDEGLLDPEGCLHVGIRGPLYDADDLVADGAVGFQLVPGDRTRAPRQPRRDRADRGPRRRPPGLRQRGHRRARPRLRARHRHPRGGRPDQPRAPRRAPLLRRTSTWSARTSSRSPPPTTTPRSPASPPPTSATSCCPP